MKRRLNFSVLMSLYYKEKPEYFRECMDSILNQTVKANEIVIVKDGPLKKDLECVLDEYIRRDRTLYNIVSLPTNKGLGVALSEGILHCSNELIARMDTDDIAVFTRFEEQLKAFEENPNLDICGTNILEFEGNINNIVAKRIVPLDDKEIKKYQKYRDSFNHVTVMYKKAAVLRAGNYQSCILMEDTLLWVHMIQSGAFCKNLQKPLVFVRVGSDMFKRRGGFDYFKKYKNGRKVIYKTGYISIGAYYCTLIVQLIVAMVPNNIRRIIFKVFLHGSVVK